ncbi:ribonuclease PH [Oceanithermus sp.]|uniref:ribonuclease PH n=1 Tax=Oceanithermus sp. TaxID=2268145 RepID=UPI0025804954|nr:ribonuclease PH [Oceanithermus sp.]
MNRADGRGPTGRRPLKITPRYLDYAEGSALVELGRTRVLVAVSLTPGVPRHMQGKRSGWLMAEYNLLPRSTESRTQRERFKLGGRTQEVQRFLGRAFRAAVDLDLLPNQTIVVDADVIQADGGTRVAAILGGYAALVQAFDALVRAGKLDDWPLTEFAAISLGWAGGDEVLVDLNAREDDRVHADLTVVGTAEGELIEIHGGGEGRPVPRAVYDRMVDEGLRQIPGLVAEVHKQLAEGVS